MKRFAAAGLGLLLALPGAAADDARAQLEQRVQLAARLLADAPTAQRIAVSGNAQAISQLDEARLHHALAAEALQRGDLVLARREVDAALRHVSQARRLVPDAAARQAAAGRRQEQMQATLARLVDAWRAHGGAEVEQDGDFYAAQSLIASARGFAEAGRHIDAVFTLDLAERHVLAGMNRALHARELDYTQRAATPEQEFQIELLRYQGLSELVPLAVSELRPRADAQVLIERYGQTSRELHAQALQKSQGGDAAGALEPLRQAMLFLQRALQAAGVALPQATGSGP